MIRSNLKLSALIVSATPLSFFASRPATAQQDHALSIGANYTYVRTNVVPGCDCLGMNGGGAQVEYGLRPIFPSWEILRPPTKEASRPTTTTSRRGIRYRPALSFHHVQPFGDLLFGAAHTTGALSADNTGFGSSTAFAFQTGGGVELRLSKRWTLVPVQADYLLTTEPTIIKTA